MSDVRIKDGTGNGNQAKVGNDNRLHTDSVNKTESQYAIFQGYGFNVSTGLITLTSDGASAVGYFSYTGDAILVVKEILVILGDSTGGSGVGTIELVRNPTGGTIISTATNVSVAANRDFSSNRALAGLAYKGAEGNTLTGGTTFALTTRDNFSQPIAFDSDIIVLRKGNSIGVKYTPPSGNTSQNVVIAGTLFEDLAFDD